ncbi:flagellar motor protein MotB [Spirochaeta dissipatitropha]
MAVMPKKKKKEESGAPEYMLTYGDMVTLLLTFFVMILTTATVDGYELQLILSAFSGVGSFDGGSTLQEGRLVELGNTVMSLPSMDRGRALDRARRTAVSMFEPEIRSQKVRVTEDERGLIITLAADAFFDVASAEVRFEETRDLLQRLARLLSTEELRERSFRIEGHTDSDPTDPQVWRSNWELSVARSLNIFWAIMGYANPAIEEQFQIQGLGETRPLVSNNTPEGRAYNRRVDLVILSDGHL